MASNEQMYSSERIMFNREVIARQYVMLERSEWHSCGNCTHLRFEGQAPKCGLYDLAPPLPVLVCSCESWEERAPF